MKTINIINCLVLLVVFPIVYVNYPTASVWTYFFIGGAVGIVNLFLYQIVIRIWPHVADKN